MKGKGRSGLGRGLSDINQGLGELLTTIDQTQADAHSGYTTQRLAIDKIQSGPYQPRQAMDPQGLEELAQSIRQHGILQPLLVRAVAAERYELIAGERRWQAAKLAQCDDVPVLVRDISDETAMAMGIIENVQREDLNAIDQAVALDRLLSEFGMTHEQVATAIGKSRTTVTNLLRLLHLDEGVKSWVSKGELSMGHARCLLSLPTEQQPLAGMMMKEQGLSVRQSEALVARMCAGERQEQRARKQAALCNPELTRWGEQFSRLCQMPVSIRPRNAKSGVIQIAYDDPKKIQSLLDQIALSGRMCDATDD